MARLTNLICALSVLLLTGCAGGGNGSGNAPAPMNGKSAAQNAAEGALFFGNAKSN